jgi:hypothetical protein
MHMIIHSVRYFSKIPRDSVFSGFGESVMVDSLSAVRADKDIFKDLNMWFQQAIIECSVLASS